jgi:hypothetical protein
MKVLSDACLRAAGLSTASILQACLLQCYSLCSWCKVEVRLPVAYGEIPKK